MVFFHVRHGSTFKDEVGTGPVDTTSGGAPAESPQGETPGVQAAPDGSSKTIVEPKK